MKRGRTGFVFFLLMKSILLFFSLSVAVVIAADTKPAQRSVVTDEPLQLVGKPEGAADYVAKAARTDGQHLALTLKKLEQGFDPPRPFLIWALGSSYTNMLGVGEPWKATIPRLFPNAPEIRYEKMVGNSCPWQYLRGWTRHLAVPDQDVAAVREVCRKYDVEFVENRRDWAEYLKANNLPIASLLKDAVHQSNYGAHIINSNILAHIRKPSDTATTPRRASEACNRKDRRTVPSK